MSAGEGMRSSTEGYVNLRKELESARQFLDMSAFCLVRYKMRSAEKRYSVDSASIDVILDRKILELQQATSKALMAADEVHLLLKLQSVSPSSLKNRVARRYDEDKGLKDKDGGEQVA